jgi:hypothetical protein
MLAARAQVATVLGGSLAALLLACHGPAAAAPKKPHRHHVDLSFVAPADAESAPAVRYGQLDRSSCEAELERRGVPFSRVDEARGVLAPVRLTGPVRGVTFHSGVPASQRATSPYEILDCRLVLALDDFARLLAEHGVIEVIHYSAYRPPSKKLPDGALGSRHPGALALDAAKFRKSDGTVLDVEKDFHGRIGAATCGPKAVSPRPTTPAAVELRKLVCDAADQRLFNVALTPNFNWPHRNHFHLEVTPSAKWFLVH